MKGVYLITTFLAFLMYNPDFAGLLVSRLPSIVVVDTSLIGICQLVIVNGNNA
jgi:hypothetical protein